MNQSNFQTPGVHWSVAGVSDFTNVFNGKFSKYQLKQFHNSVFMLQVCLSEKLNIFMCSKFVEMKLAVSFQPARNLIATVLCVYSVILLTEHGSYYIIQYILTFSYYILLIIYTANLIMTSTCTKLYLICSYMTLMYVINLHVCLKLCYFLKIW